MIRSFSTVSRRIRSIIIAMVLAATALGGVDAFLAIAQMPKGVPVGTLAIGQPGAANAALLAARIVALSDRALRDRLVAWTDARRDAVLKEGTPP